MTRRAGIILCLAALLCGAVGGCRDEPTSIRLRITLAAELPLELTVSELFLWVYHEGDGRAVPPADASPAEERDGRQLQPTSGGGELLPNDVVLFPAQKSGELRILVRGRASFGDATAEVARGWTTVEIEQGRQREAEVELGTAALEDSDGDGVPDVIDNCDAEPNPLQQPCAVDAGVDGDDGGGDGGDGPPADGPAADAADGPPPDGPSPDGPVVDQPTTPFAVLSIDPPDGAADVGVTPTITVTFSVPVDQASIGPTTFTVRPQGTFALSGAYSFPSATEVVFTPTWALSLDTTFDVELTTSVRDTAQRQLAQSFQSSFKSSSGSWRTPSTLASGVVGGQGVIDPAGDALVVWDAVSGSNHQPFARHFTPAGGWGLLAALDPQDCTDLARPRVAVDADGDAIAAWRSCSGVLDLVRANRFSHASDSWLGVETVRSMTARPIFDVELAVDGNAHGAVVWREGPATINLWGSYSSGASWTTAVEIEAQGNTATPTGPRVASVAAGSAVVWQQKGAVAQSIWFSRYSVGSGWSTPQQLDESASDCSAPDIAVGGGVIYVVWLQPFLASDKVWSRRYDGSSWSAPTQVESAVGDAFEPRVSANSDGVAVVVWRKGSEAVRAARYVSGWEQLGTIDASGVTASAPRVGVDDAGRALAIWVQGPNLWANRYAGGAWGTAAVLEAAAAQAQLPELHVAGNGSALAVWHDNGDLRSSFFR